MCSRIENIIVKRIDASDRASSRAKEALTVLIFQYGLMGFGGSHIEVISPWFVEGFVETSTRGPKRRFEKTVANHDGTSCVRNAREFIPKHSHESRDLDRKTLSFLEVRCFYRRRRIWDEKTLFNDKINFNIFQNVREGKA